VRVTFISTLKRWFRHRAQRDFEFKSQPTYWKIRRVFAKVYHHLVTKRFYATEAGRNIAQSSQIIAILAKQIVKDVIVAFGIFAIAVVADQALQSSGIGLAEHHWPGLASNLRSWTESASNNNDQIQSFLNTVVQLAGLFLTLYFTAISLIASTVYARVPGDVRTLAVDEKVGNVYIRVVAILGAIAILYLLGSVLGLQIGLIGILAIGTLSITSLFSFLVLGKRTFNFFQPTVFVQFLVNELAKWIKLSSGGKRTTQTPSLQDYYRRRAEGNLRTYRDIVSLATTEEFHRIEADALVTLLNFTVDIATFYERRKPAISSQSLWFEKINKHRQWLTVGHTELELALATGRPIDPELVPNLYWFEEWCQALIEKASHALTIRDDSQHWFKFANRLYHRLEEFGHLFAIEEALLFFRSQREEIGLLLQQTKPAAGFASDASNRRLGFYIGAIAFVCSDLIAILIGFARRLEEITDESLPVLAENLLRNQPEAIYSARLPRAVIAETESISASLRAEELIEGKIVTPEWYVSQLLGRGFIEFIKASCLSFITELEETFEQNVREQQNAGQHLFAAQIISSGIEACDKLHVHFANARRCVERLEKLRKVQDIPWTDVNWKELHEQISQLHGKLMAYAADILPPLEQVPATRYWPDYFGQLYSFVAREAYLAMSRGNEDLFGKLFPSLFASGILANQKLRQQFKDREPRTMIALSSGPLEDIIALSGYAKLFTELDGKAFYTFVTRTWDVYLASFESPKNPLMAITALLEYRTGDFFMPARDLERTGWQQNFERLLRDRKILQEHQSGYDAPREPAHPSKLIQEISRGGILMEHASDVFLVDYVMPKLAGEKITFPYTARNLAEALRRNRAQ
jgi:hypothetical protein